MAVLALVAGGCAWAPGVVAQRPQQEPSRPCTVAAVRSCALPYPSDEFTVADPASATGRRLAVPDDLVPARTLAQLGPGAGPADAFDGADGYAALTPVFFELDRGVRPSTLPADGGDVLTVHDLTTGQKVPIRAEVPVDALRYGDPDTIVAAWPRVRYEPGHTYLAVLGPGLRAHAGGTPSRALGLDGGSDWARSLRDDVERIGAVSWDRVVSATRFTVRSSANATADLGAMAAVVRSRDHPVRITRVDPPLLVPGASAVVNGEVAVTDFRDDDGIARAANGGHTEWVKFLLVLPEEPAGTAGAPVAVYGHGLSAAKETMGITASLNAERGVATIGIDVPNHGDRQTGQGGYLFDLATPRAFGRLASMPLQGVLDNLSLLLGVRDHLGSVPITIPAFLDAPERPAPPLDTSTVLYQGTSMGGVLGATFAALAPELDGAFLQVAGTGIADTILHSLLWPLFMGVVPHGAAAGDAFALMGAATMLLDHADNVNVIERLRDPSFPLFLTYGIGDGVVQNVMSERMATLADLPLVRPHLSSPSVQLRALSSDGVPADGRGVAQVWSSWSPELRSFGAHVSFGEARSERLLEQWLDGRLAAAGLR